MTTNLSLREKELTYIPVITDFYAPRPKFSIGEEVYLLSEDKASRNHYTVIGVELFQSTDYMGDYCGVWRYRITDGKKWNISHVKEKLYWEDELEVTSSYEEF